MGYSEKIKDPRWQKKRLEILQRDDFRCKWCGDKESTLHVHHIAYLKGNIWDTPDNLLITLCETCHSEEESHLNDLRSSVFNDLRKQGFTSISFSNLPMIFNKDRGWGLYEPAFDVLKMVVEDDDLWKAMEDKFWEKLNKKISDGKTIY